MRKENKPQKAQEAQKVFVLLVPLVASLLVAISISAAQRGAPVRLIASNGVKPAIEALSRSAEAAIGHPVASQFSTTAFFRQRINEGQAFEVAVLTSEAIDDLIKQGKIVARSRVDVGSIGIGVGIKKGSKKPDIATADAIKQTLLNAKSITYAQEGASRPAIEKMLSELGIADKTKPKTILKPSSDGSNAAVAAGEAEMIITLTSEIMPAPGVELVGSLPAKFQNYVHFAAGVSTSATDADAANAFVKFLTDPKAAATYQSKGIQPAK